jgi:hypothetical protein
MLRTIANTDMVGDDWVASEKGEAQSGHAWVARILKLAALVGMA